MAWAEYRHSSQKAKVHLGFDVNRGIPARVFLSEGKPDERPFASRILEPRQTAVMVRYYQCHRDFDQRQTEDKHFICRIRANTSKTVVEQRPVAPGSHIFFDAV